MNDRLKALADAGVSIWLDDLSRERLDSGNLSKLIAEDSVVGVTTNPTIFASALSKGEAYDVQLKDLAADSATVPDAIKAVTTTDVRNACDVMAATASATGGVDGRVSLEVSPKLALDTDGTIAEARELWSTVDRPNLLIKIPATKQGIPAIRTAISEGISVNVTLIFGLGQYENVIEAYLSGLEQAAEAGHDLSRIHSVASFFVSRVDTEYDKRLDAIGTDEAKALRSKAAIANARLAYELYEKSFAGDRWAALEAKGAHVQRPLWASTGVKDPNLPDTLYVTELVVPHTVNTMPEKTLLAFADHGEVKGDRVTTMYDDAHRTMDALAGLGIDYDEVIDTLESEGVDKFMKSWDELTDSVEHSLHEVSGS
ncbi:transaldolase [Friedmanniella endophytica]|uniref:Transaldolase n=1 Tax=Microlunatus kandeliicorticis TaxID=1759536 RepID=A0A7W3P5U7_9ACTN|nr:transaldolase [Microlunatus kandeliicorticis]MBA8794262.1 transaldolase [Microlunatus kandeliicorticis]